MPRFAHKVDLFDGVAAKPPFQFFEVAVDGGAMYAEPPSDLGLIPAKKSDFVEFLDDRAEPRVRTQVSPAVVPPPTDGATCRGLRVRSIGPICCPHISAVFSL